MNGQLLYIAARCSALQLRGGLVAQTGHYRGARLIAVVRNAPQERQILVGQHALLGTVLDRLQIRLRRLPLGGYIEQSESVLRIGDLLVDTARDQLAVLRFDRLDELLVDVLVDAFLAVLVLGLQRVNLTIAVRGDSGGNTHRSRLSELIMSISQMAPQTEPPTSSTIVADAPCQRLDCVMKSRR